jgi:hypothetical protein
VVVDDFYKHDVLRNNPYIDFLIPGNNTNIFWDNADIAIRCHWSFYEQHQHGHVCQSYNQYINGKHYEDLTMEMFQNQHDVSHVKQVLSGVKRHKPLVVVFPNYTMYNRMIPKKDWQILVDRLIPKYHVVSLGNKCDHELENVTDLRGVFKINQIPLFLDHVEMVFTCCSGSLHIAGCNPKVKIVLLNVGEFPSALHLPYRNGSVGWNCETIEHQCPYKDACFEGHIKETEFQKQLKTNIFKYGATEHAETIKKYTAWHYCYKSSDKYSCSRYVMKALLLSGLC